MILQRTVLHLMSGGLLKQRTITSRGTWYRNG